MSIAAAVTAALPQYKLDEETGFNRLADFEVPCLHCVLSLIATYDLSVCLMTCTLCKRDHQKCTAIPLELKAVVQTYWNALNAEFTAGRLRLEKWRGMQSVLEAIPVAQLLATAPALLLLSKLQNLLSIENFLLFPTEFSLAPRSITQNIRRTVPAYARECPEADAFFAVLEHLPTAFEMPVEGDNSRESAKFFQPNSLTSSLTTWIASSPKVARLLAMHGPYCKSRHWKHLSSRKSDGPGPSDEEVSGGLQVLGGFSVL